MRSISASVTLPYTPGSRVPRRFRFGPCKTRIFTPRGSLASAGTERRDEPVGDREEQEPREHRPAERGSALAVHLRDEIRPGHAAGDPRRPRKRVADVALRHEARA